MSEPVVDVFLACCGAVRSGALIARTTDKDKEFHFQNWFRDRLAETTMNFDQGGRNSYPDFTLVHHAEGYEIKGLAYPGRSANYDSNSQAPTGFHNGRTVYYLFGRYPAKPDRNEYPVFDLVMCHGDFLNADHDYVHKNRSFRGFGSYGDIIVRDRKMYVAPTPYALTRGTEGQLTIILPLEVARDQRLTEVGRFMRIEADQLVTSYNFDLTGNALTPTYRENPTAGAAHAFVAYRATHENGPEVTLVPTPEVVLEIVKDEGQRQQDEEAEN